MAKRERQQREDYTARFPPGTLGRMEKALKGRESKADFIRLAVDEKLRQRERGAVKASGAT